MDESLMHTQDEIILYIRIPYHIKRKILKYKDDQNMKYPYDSNFKNTKSTCVFIIGKFLEDKCYV